MTNSCITAIFYLSFSSQLLFHFNFVPCLSGEGFQIIIVKFAPTSCVALEATSIGRHTVRVILHMPYSIYTGLNPTLTMP